MIYLTLEEILTVAARAIGNDIQVRDAGLLESALARPQATVYGVDAYPDLHSKTAALALSICQNHTLVDGNKRLALAATLVMLGVNGWNLVMSNDEAYLLIIAMADGELTDVSDVAARLKAGSQPS